MSRLTVGEKHVVPLLLPGIALVVGVAAVFIVRDWRDFQPWTAAALTDLAEREGSGWGAMVAAGLALGGVALYLASLFAGVVLAIVGGLIESHGLDWYRASQMKLTEDQYNRQWYRYVDSLEHTKNPYIDGFVDIFLFTLRFALAAALVGLLAMVTGVVPAWASLILLLVGVVSFLIAVRDHRELADFRNRRWRDVYPAG